MHTKKYQRGLKAYQTTCEKSFLHMKESTRRSPKPLTDQIMEVPIRDFKCIPSDEMVKKYDQYDYPGWLKKNNVKLDYGVIAVKVARDNGVKLGINLIEMVGDLAFDHPDQKWSEPAKGFDAIPKAMAKEFEKKLNGKILLNYKVRKIKRVNIGKNNEKVN